MFFPKSYQWSIMCVCGVRKLCQTYRNELLEVLIKIYYVKVAKQVFLWFYWCRGMLQTTKVMKNYQSTTHLCPLWIQYHVQGPSRPFSEWLDMFIRIFYYFITFYWLKYVKIDHIPTTPNTFRLYLVLLYRYISTQIEQSSFFRIMNSYRWMKPANVQLSNPLFFLFIRQKLTKLEMFEVRPFLSLISHYTRRL